MRCSAAGRPAIHWAQMKCSAFAEWTGLAEKRSRTFCSEYSLG